MGSRSKSLETFILGVSGMIGSGKSTLCRFLQEQYGFHWIHADKIVAQLYKVGQPGYRKIRDYFGKYFVGQSSVYRGRLRRFVLKTPQKMWILNKLIHPLVTHEVNKKIVQLKRAGSTWGQGWKGRGVKGWAVRICIEAVYFEKTDLGKFINELIIVDAPDFVLLKRLKLRKIPMQQLKTLLTFQRKNLPKFGMKVENVSSKRAFFEKIAKLHFF